MNATPVVATFAGAAVVATTGAALVAAGAAAKVGQTAAAKVGEGISIGLGATKDGVDAVVEKVKQMQPGDSFAQAFNLKNMETKNEEENETFINGYFAAAMVQM